MLNVEQVERYREDGFILIEKLLDHETLASMRSLTDDFVEHSRSITASDAVFDLDPSHGASTW